MKVMVLGVSGMLGNAVFRHMSGLPRYQVTGTARSASACGHFAPALRDAIVTGVDVENTDSLLGTFAAVKPEVVINCIGLIKQLTEANDPLAALPVNALLPHRLARLCAATGARVVHVSTDCVFSGAKGMYREEDPSDAKDLYGRSKYLGEVDYPHAITLRTSIIGHELNSAHALIGWFLAQQGRIKGFTKAIFSGLPTVELARVISDYVLPRPELRGLYHVSAEPIAKYDLLQLVAGVYGKQIAIDPDDGVEIDRSLDSTRFRQATGYLPPDWPTLVRAMHQFG
ncbi:dTDP-4-dehydrorhamnose reductase [Cupriavidus taiwanensis]|uniref:dTDP-4-dehydrorhamnose reductase family protein n=1 Tax=Cupriavidus taiwanensis TaxID=164546 RepID=UPI000E152BD4|nr:SDR family oxidoreductase [Cupriavidus taiwanensis]SOZ13906.1 dTDP-4-dehydrorhamnose reductase [Cupriavidus taiwanensis]SOZ24617.1 dTDP-4-dehydrorhamnose reductase [Cupriavidus taiwanensis]SOZ44519.1 dTDP-4-dehydrorhamnose reductase [Cupriavidus taiwanensis]